MSGCEVPGCSVDAGDKLFCRAHRRFVTDDDYWAIRMSHSSPLFGRGDLVSDKHRDAVVEAWGIIDGHEVVWREDPDGVKRAVRGVGAIAKMMRAVEYWMSVAAVGEAAERRARAKRSPGSAWLRGQ